MDVNLFLTQLDQLYSQKMIDKVEPFFDKSLETAIKERDLGAEFTILNEMMGFFRDTSQYDKSIDACQKCLQLMNSMGIEGTVDYATSLQNIANAHRAAGLLSESMDFYNKALDIYNDNIEEGDYRMASINNNIALLYQEMGDFEESCNHLREALYIIEQLDDSEIEVAITYSNLAASLLELEKIDEAMEYLDKALTRFRKDEVKNFHYSAALSAMAAAQCKLNNYEDAVSLYEEALREIEINMGRGTAYNITKENLEKVYRKLKNNSKERNVYSKSDIVNNLDGKLLTGIELADRFYHEVGAKMIHDKFPQYENKIAVAFVGEGSERFGFDDEYSRDHDFGPGFSMFVTEETYSRIGRDLDKEYNKLPKSYLGVTRVDTVMAQGRLGVQIIGDFYKKYTGFAKAPTEITQWIDIEDYKLATVTNGVVFRDDEGIFTDIRHQFMNQPEAARRVKLARGISTMAQVGQCNYCRAMARKDYVTANICISEFMKHTMQCVFILNRKYAPYYKWLFQGIKNMEILPEIRNLLNSLADTPDQRRNWESYEYTNTSINPNDKKSLIIEEIARLVITELYNQQLIPYINSDFLNDYVGVIMQSVRNVIRDSGVKMTASREDIIDEIVKLEYEAFDKVQNVGGRAECQDDWPFFEIMRKSQYMTWTDEMLYCIRDLWLENKAKGWNMITEKYGRMMESTAPHEYEQIKDNFPVKSEKTKSIVDQIAKIQVQWMEEFADRYPKLAANARDITSNSDELYNTSYETYLKGELLTYSEKLLKLYGRFVINMAREGQNLAYKTIENTVHLQGYKTLERAEESIIL